MKMQVADCAGRCTRSLKLVCQSAVSRMERLSGTGTEPAFFGIDELHRADIS